MDPLSITATCIGLVSTIAKTSLVITTFVREVRGARSELDSVSRELLSLKQILELLADDTSDPTNGSLPEALRKQVAGIVTNCGVVVGEIEKILGEHEGNKLSKAAFWALDGKNDMAKLRSSLEAHKSALEIALDMVTLTLARDIKADTQEIRSDTSAIKEDTAQILAEIARLQRQLPQDPHRQNDTGFVLERYLDNLTTYAESVCDTTVDFDEDFSTPRMSYEKDERKNEGNSQTWTHSPDAGLPRRIDHPREYTLVNKLNGGTAAMPPLQEVDDRSTDLTASEREDNKREEETTEKSYPEYPFYEAQNHHYPPGFNDDAPYTPYTPYYNQSTMKPNHTETKFRSPGTALYPNQSTVSNPYAVHTPVLNRRENIHYTSTVSADRRGSPEVQQPPPIPTKISEPSGIKLWKGQLILDVPIPSYLLNRVPHSAPPGRDEFTHLRYSGVNCSPQDFSKLDFCLRPQLFALPRQIEIMISVTISVNYFDGASNSRKEALALAQTLSSIVDFIRVLNTTKNNQMGWGETSWKKIIVVINSTRPVSQTSQSVLQAMGLVQTWYEVVKNLGDRSDVTDLTAFPSGVNGKVVQANLFEYTTQFKPRTDANSNVVYSLDVEPSGSSKKKYVPVQMVACLPNEQPPTTPFIPIPLSWMSWPQAFAQHLKPRVCIEVDSGVKVNAQQIHKYWDTAPLTSGSLPVHTVIYKEKIFSSLYNGLLRRSGASATS